MQNTILWLIVAIVVVVIIVLAVIGVMRSRGRRVGFEPRALAAEDLEGREERIDEIERMFVHQPREAVAAARLQVDEMLTRMGYPVRLTAVERSRDLGHFNRAYADRYRTAGELRDDASTEEMRRATPELERSIRRAPRPLTPTPPPSSPPQPPPPSN